MKILLLILFCLLPSFAITSDTRVFQDMQKDFGSIIVKDLNQKKLIFSKDENQVLRPASLTKIMTAIIAPIIAPTIKPKINPELDPQLQSGF